MARLVIDPGAGSEWRPISWETLLAPFTRSPNPWVAETSAAWLDHLSTALSIVNARTRWNRLRPGDPIPLVMLARMSWVYSRLKPPAPLVADFMASGGNKAWVARIQMPAPAAVYVVAAEIEDPSGRSWPARFESNGPNPVTGPRVWVGLRQHGVDGSEGFNWDYLAALWPLMRSACNDWMATRPGLPAAHDRAAWHRIGAPLGLIKPGATALPVQYGGAAGTRAPADGRGLDLAAHLAKLLALRDPGLPWHTVRLPIGDLAGALGTAGGIIAKIAGDVILLAQTEIGELSDADRARGGSSAMAHKANPVAAVCARACAHRGPGLVATLLGAMEQEHQRAAGAWHSEWRTLCDLLVATGSAAAWLRDCLEHLVVHPDRMAQNLTANLQGVGTGDAAALTGFALQEHARPR